LSFSFPLVWQLKPVEKRILKQPKRKKRMSLSPMIRKARPPRHPSINLPFGVLLEVVWEEEPVE
jgi:hypothetical protein